MTKKKIDVLVLFIFIILTNVFFYFIDDVLITIPLGSFLFLGPPLLYLSLREKKDWIKILATVLVIGFVVGLPFTFLGELTYAWTIYAENWRLFNVFYFPVVIGWMLMTALTIAVYQHFYIGFNNKVRGISNRFKPIVICLLIISTLIIVLCIYWPNIFTKKYSYLIFGSINFIPVAYYIIKRPKFIISLLPLGLYFFMIYFSMEYIGLTSGLWAFNGSYIGEVYLFGVNFPIEEFVYWMLLFAISTICCYKAFISVKVEH
ncbi:MAG: hypothetical protein HWD85_12455 [Flavobacteriaceae bacterium]|nr:hypothetical protein [Flavobacteriaceae bacterium]